MCSRLTQFLDSANEASLLRKNNIKDQIVSTVGFVGHMVSVAVIQLCHCIRKAAVGSMLAMAVFQYTIFT